MNEDAIEYFEFHRKIFCDDHLKICPEGSIAYQATLKEKEFYDLAIKALKREPCEDVISREELKKWLDMNFSFGGALRKIELFDRLDKELPPVTPTQNWIPVSERLPKKRGVYIVTEKVFSVTDKEHTGGFNLMTEQVEFDNGKWRRASFYEVVAWMLLPKPYKESEGE